jgi:hypothetical protein
LGKFAFYGITEFASFNSTSFSFQLIINNTALKFQNIADFSTFNVFFYISTYLNRYPYCP